jgi:hypothetical protein
MEKISFKQFLALDPVVVESLLLEIGHTHRPGITSNKKKPKAPPKPKPRPRKTLWFDDPNMWNADLQFAHSGKFEYHTSEEEEQSSRHVFAVDPKTKACYGVWQGSKKRGVTFHTPRPLHALKSPRMTIRQINQDNQ